MSQNRSQRSPDPQAGASPESSSRDDWSDVTDPNERRKRQNRLAQRRYRKKVQEQKEETAREEENQRRAAASYTTAESSELESHKDLSGLPWGGISMKHIVESGKAKDHNSQQSSRETSVWASASRTGGSSRVGLRLMDQFARGAPAWKRFPFGHPGWGHR